MDRGATLAIYVSLIPFDFRGVPFDRAVARFSRVMQSPYVEPMSRTNYMANIPALRARGLRVERRASARPAAAAPNRAFSSVRPFREQCRQPDRGVPADIRPRPDRVARRRQRANARMRGRAVGWPVAAVGIIGQSGWGNLDAPHPTNCCRTRRSASLFTGRRESQRINAIPGDAKAQYLRNLTRARWSVPAARVSVLNMEPPPSS